MPPSTGGRTWVAIPTAAIVTLVAITSFVLLSRARAEPGCRPVDLAGEPYIAEPSLFGVDPPPGES